MSKEAVSLPVNYEDLSITNDFLKVINTRFQVYLGGLGIFMPQRLRYCSQCSTRSEHIPCQCASEGMHAVMLSGLFGYAGFEKVSVYCRIKCCSASYRSKRSSVPFGSQMGSPLPTFSENMNSSISLPILRWSRFFASSSITRYSSSIFFLGNEIP